jgi:hypothetical protein
MFSYLCYNIPKKKGNKNVKNPTAMHLFKCVLIYLNRKGVVKKIFVEGGSEDSVHSKA